MTDIILENLAPEEVISAMTGLQSTPGWKLVKELLERDLTNAQNMLSNKQFEDLHEVRDLQVKIAYIIHILSFPTTLIAEYKKSVNVEGEKSPIVEKENGDPYD